MAIRRGQWEVRSIETYASMCAVLCVLNYKLIFLWLVALVNPSIPLTNAVHTCTFCILSFALITFCLALCIVVQSKRLLCGSHILTWPFLCENCPTFPDNQTHPKKGEGSGGGGGW